MGSTLLIILSLALLYVGAEALVRGSAGLAVRLGVSPLVVGLTVVSFGTSSPELVVSVRAALSGSGGVAIGNVVGSNIANVALILGLSALVRPVAVQASLIRRDVPILVGVTLFATYLLADGTLGRGAGFLLAAGALGYTLLVIRLAREEADPQVRREFAAGVPAPRRQAWVEILLVLFGLGLLVAGGETLVSVSVTLARRLGVSETLVGLTLVAVGTSLPELATSVVAAARGEADIAAGNVIGSNVFNILGILGTSAALRPIRAPGIGTVDLLAFCLTALVTLPILRSGFEVDRREGAVLILLYAAYVAYRWVTAAG